MKPGNFILNSIDALLYKVLMRLVDQMPMRGVKFISYFYPDARVRKAYLRRLGVEMGENTFANFGLIHIGNNSEISVFIGNNVSIAANLTLVSESSPNNSKLLSNNPYISENLYKIGKIHIEDDVWIGANVTILPGVRIGRGSIIGACSLVNKDIPAGTVSFGIPAVVRRKLPDA